LLREGQVGTAAQGAVGVAHCDQLIR
jgi:hypothetical protein